MRPSELQLIARTRADLASGKAAGDRDAAGVSRAEIAAAVGVTPQAVGYWERGQIAPNAGHALAYGRLLARLSQKAALAGMWVLT